MPMARGNDQKPWSLIALPMHANIIMAHGAPLFSPSTRAPMTNWSNWRENIRPNPFPWPPQSPTTIHHLSSSSYDETSISNPTASRCTVLSLDSCSGDEPADNHHMWSHLLLNGEAPNSQDDAESFMEVLSSKKFSADQFESTTCHTLMHPSSQLNFLEIQLNSYKNNNNTNNIQEHHLAPSMTNSYMQSDTSHLKHKLNYPVSQLFPSNLLLGESTKSDNMSRYQNITRVESVVLDHPCFSQRNLLDKMPLGGCLNKLDAMELRTPEPYLKDSDWGGETKQEYQNSSMRGNGRCAGTNEGKRKRSEDNSEMHSRKTKNDSQMISSNKLPVPKAKMAEKISALQQLVSPFGKTDQASVLMETINCIRILQKQVQLLSDPYLKSTVSKECDSWGETERKDKAEAKYDLRSKGLCLVPVSSIPQVHRESIRPDYWMPTLRGCFL